VAVPLIAGEVIRSHATGLARLERAAISVLFAAAAAVQALCFYAASRFAAVGADGPWWFLGGDGWSPPLGWAIWLVVAAVGVVLLAVAGLGRGKAA